MTIYFYGADEVPYGCFSNFSAHAFELDGHTWPTSEHYFQAQKFTGTRHADLIRRARTPLRAAELGRDTAKPLRRDWERVKDDVMRRAVEAKFRTHDDIRAILLSTGDEEIVEDTTTDHPLGTRPDRHRKEHARPHPDAHPHPAARRSLRYGAVVRPLRMIFDRVG